MCKYSVQEFADLCGVKRQYISTYQKRGKLIVSDGMLDLKNPLNKNFYNKKRAQYIDKVKSGTLPVNTPVSKLQTTQKKEQTKPKTAPIVENDSETGNNESPNESPNGSQTNLSIEKLEAEVRKKNADAAKAELELERMQGKLLDMDTAKAILGAYMRTFTNGLFRDLETFVGTTLDIYKVRLEEKTRHTSKLEGLINNASERTMAEMVNILESDELKVSKNGK